MVGDPAVIADANHSGLRVVRVQQAALSHRWLTLDEVPKTLEAVFEKPRRDLEKPKMTLAQVGMGAVTVGGIIVVTPITTVVVTIMIVMIVTVIITSGATSSPPSAAA